MTRLNALAPHQLPSLPELRARLRALAALAAILCPEWEYRYYSYNCRWAPGEEMASMRDGEGNEWFLLFDVAGAAIKGFDHELHRDCDVSEAIQREVPSSFGSFLKEPAFSMQRATFCYWLADNDGTWQKVDGNSGRDDGSMELLALLAGDASTYKEWAESYFDIEVPLPLVRAVFEMQPITDEIVRGLNPEATLEALAPDLEEIGYAFREGPVR